MAFQVLWVYRLLSVSIYYRDAALKVNHNMTRAAVCRGCDAATSLPALSLLSSTMLCLHAPPYCHLNSDIPPP